MFFFISDFHTVCTVRQIIEPVHLPRGFVPARPSCTRTGLPREGQCTPDRRSVPGPGNLFCTDWVRSSRRIKRRQVSQSQVIMRMHPGANIRGAGGGGSLGNEQSTLSPSPGKIPVTPLAQCPLPSTRRREISKYFKYLNVNFFVASMLLYLKGKKSFH